MKEKIMKILKGENPLIDVWHYIVGNYRYKLYYSKGYYGSPARKWKITRAEYRKHPLMRKHIWEQINFRIRVMNAECYQQGSCIKCGCETTKLQMANKACEGHCYPAMMSKYRWNKVKYTIGQFYKTKNNV